MSFSFATWNILATAYIRPEWYPRTPPHLLDPTWRVPALVRHALALDVDILCLQEVEADVFAALRDGLAPQGYSGRFATKGANRPDGCATFFRADRFALLDDRRLAYADGSGHVAQILQFRFRQEDRELAIANTHLKWDPPGAPRERQWGYGQVVQALGALNSPHARILCGDLNAKPESDVVSALLAAGFDYTHRGLPETRTCNSNAEPKLIDYVFYGGALRADPLPVPLIDAETPLPSHEQPSDHLPLTARFAWLEV